jgi:AraC-like DNA-binding protein
VPPLTGVKKENEMEEVQTEVNQPEGASTSESIEQESVESQESSQSTDHGAQTVETPEAPTSPAPQPGYQEVDDLGVPWKNRYMESQKKLDKMAEQLNTVAQKVESSVGQKEEKYSIEELQSFIEEADNPAHKNWARKEIQRIQKEEVGNTVKSVINEWKTEQEKQQLKQSALQTVMTRYPDAFSKDANGNFVGWNPSSPMAQRIGFHMQDPEIANNPRGLTVAAALAYSDLAQSQLTSTVKTATKLKSEVKDLQKKTLTEGGGVSSPPPAKTPLNSANERFKQSGSIKDGTTVFKEILKGRGRIKEG